MKPIGSIRRCRIRRLAQLIDQSSKSWDGATLRRYFHHGDVEEIQKIKIPTTPCEDWFSWNFEKSGIFFVRSAYRLAMRDVHELGATGSSSRPDGERAIWKKLWKIPVPRRLRFLRGKSPGMVYQRELIGTTAIWIKRGVSCVECK
jgi:hypothetical protein